MIRDSLLAGTGADRTQALTSPACTHGWIERPPHSVVDVIRVARLGARRTQTLGSGVECFRRKRRRIISEAVSPPTHAPRHSGLRTCRANPEPGCHAACRGRLRVTSRASAATPMPGAFRPRDPLTPRRGRGSRRSPSVRRHARSGQPARFRSDLAQARQGAAPGRPASRAWPRHPTAPPPRASLRGAPSCGGSLRPRLRPGSVGRAAAGRAWPRVAAPPRASGRGSQRRPGDRSRPAQPGPGSRRSGSAA